MLDFNINLEFKPDFPISTKGNVDRLVITSCAIHLFSDDRIWSAFEEQTFNRLNTNDYGFGVVDFEIGFSGYSGVAYPQVYTKCFDLRTDNGLRIMPMKYRNTPSESKVNQRDETVIGIRYYFKKEEEIEQFVSCDRLMFECFFALDKPKNTYALMCQLKKDNSVWHAEYANTFRPDYAKNIKHLID